MGKDTNSDEGNATLSSSESAAETAATTSQTPAETAGASTSSSVEELRAQVARMDAALKKANAEAAKQRKDAGELRSYKSEQEAAKLSEQERREQALTDLQAKLATAETERQQERITNAIALQAAQMGINPTLAARLVDPTDLAFDEAGKPTNVKDVLAAAVKEFGIQPAQNGTARSTAGGATNPARSASNQAHIDREFVAKLTPQQYAGLTAAQKQEVQAVMQSSSKVRGH